MSPDDRQRIPTIGLVVPDAVPHEVTDEVYCSHGIPLRRQTECLGCSDLDGERVIDRGRAIVPRIPTLEEHRRAVALSPTATIMLNDAVEGLAGTIGGDPSNVTWTLGPDRGKPGRMRLIVEASFDAAGLNAFAEAMKGRR